MFWVELILVLAIIFLGVRKGGTFLAMAGGVGMLIMTFFFHVTPADPPVTVIYTMGSGAGYGAAYMESICIFMEMQWLDSSSIHTGEYFHGPFEITDANRPFMIQISEGSTRELDERALKFLHTYAKRIEVLDAKELGLSTIDASVVDYFNHSLFNNVYPIYNHELAEKKEHPLSTRRYMWKVEY